MDLTQNLANDVHAEAKKLINDTSTLFALLWSEDFKLIDCNDKSFEFTGAEKDALLNSYFDFCPPMQPDGQISSVALRAYIKKTLKEGFCTFDWTYLSNDQIIATKKSFVRQRINNINYVIVYTTEVLEVNYEQRLQRHYKRTQTLLKHLPIGVDIWSMDRELIDCNESSVRMFGLNSKKEYIENFKSLTPEFQPNGRKSAEMVPEYLAQAATEGYVRFEWMHVHPDGRDLPAEIILTHVKMDAEEFIIAYYTDLTIIKEGSKKIEQAEQRMQYILDSAPYSITMWNTDFKPIDCNLATLNFFGHDDKEDFFNNYRSAMPSIREGDLRYADVFNNLFTQVFEDGYAYFEGELYHSKNNEKYFIETTLRKLSIHGQDFAVAYLNDLTYQKAMLNEIVESHRKISIARDAAEKSTQVKSEFLANMSHEIRTPMNGILGLIHLLNLTNIQGQQKEYVDKIRHSAESLLRIINDILDFSKIEAGKLEIENTSFTLAEIQEDLYTLFVPKFAEKGLYGQIFDTNCIETRLIGDPLRLKQVLLNLIGNAIKFTSSGSIITNASLNVDYENEKVYCKFYVSDTGVGLDKEQTSRLFKAFGQADTSVTRKYGGTGLGLVISKRIVEMMDGKIWVESELGKGSKFCFTAVFDLDTSIDLSINSKGTVDTTVTPNVDDTIIGNEYAWPTGKILLVEDNEINQLIAKELLNTRGHQVDIANNGQEAIDMLNKSTYDLVLMDIQMPIMDGLTATTKIRKDTRFNDLPIIAMSAHAMKGDKEISLKHGMNNHLSKPIDPDELYNCINEWLNK